jgi:hypothetical protein
MGVFQFAKIKLLMLTTLKLSSGTLNSERLGNGITYSSLGGKKSNVSKKDSQKQIHYGHKC